jgi:tetratricopeptide (TPR) repeat protein
MICFACPLCGARCESGQATVQEMDCPACGERVTPHGPAGGRAVSQAPVPEPGGKPRPSRPARQLRNSSQVLHIPAEPVARRLPPVVRILAVVLVVTPPLMGFLWWQTGEPTTEVTRRAIAQRQIQALESQGKLKAAAAKMAEHLAEAQAQGADAAMGAYRDFGRFYQRHGMTDECLQLWKGATVWYRSQNLKDPYRLAQAWHDLGCAYTGRENYTAALQAFAKAESLYRKSTNRHAKSNLDVLLSNVEVITREHGSEAQPLPTRVTGTADLREFDQLEQEAARLRAIKPVGGVLKIGHFYERIASNSRYGNDLEQRVAFFAAWKVAQPRSVTAKVALACALINWAWEARGSGYANTVSRDSWRLFGARIQQADANLSEAERDGPPCPGMYLQWLTVAMAQNWDRDRYDNLFNRAVALEPACYGYFTSKAYNLLPRWHGKPGEMEAFALESRNSRRDTDGDALYARIVISLVDCYTNVFRDTRLEWGIAKAGIERLIRELPGDVNLKQWRARLAFLADDQPAAAQAFADDGVSFNAEIWGARTEFERAATWARTGNTSGSETGKSQAGKVELPDLGL